MFEESLLESAHLVRLQSRWPAAASIALQAAIVAALIIVPLLNPDVAPLRTHFVELTAPRPIPPKPPVPIQRTHVDTATTAYAPSAPAQETHLQEAILRHTISPLGSSDTPPPTGVVINMGGDGHNPLATITDGAGVGSGRAIIVTKPAVPSRISLGVSAGLLLAPIRPIYPTIARAAGIHGTVVIHAVISREGHIESAAAVSGPAMLQRAALEAVRSAHYRPYLLNGQPTEVDTTFNINFRLGAD